MDPASNRRDILIACIDRAADMAARGEITEPHILFFAAAFANKYFPEGVLWGEVTAASVERNRLILEAFQRAELGEKGPAVQ